jgi:hypothetical protein
VAYETVEIWLQSHLRTNGTFTVAYPDDVTENDVAAQGHVMTATALQAVFVQDEDFTVDAGESSLTVTYLGDTTIPNQSRVVFQIALAAVSSAELSSLPVSVKRRKLNILYDEEFEGTSRSPDWSSESNNPPKPRGSWFPYPVSRSPQELPAGLYYQVGPFADISGGSDPEIPLDNGWVNVDSSTATVDLVNNPFLTTNGSAIVTVIHTAHSGIIAGLAVSFAGATAGNGITIDGDYTVLDVPGANTYRITHSAPASGSGLTGGADVTETRTLLEVGVTQKPREALVSGRTYDVGITLGQCYDPDQIDPDHGSYDPVSPDLLAFAGDVQFKLVNDAFGAGEISQAAAWTSVGDKTSTIVAGASSLYVRIACSDDFVGMLTGVVYMKPRIADLAVEGDSYIVDSADASGVWANHAGHIAVCNEDLEWDFIAPQIGMTVYVEDEDRKVIWKGSAWEPEFPGMMSNPVDVYRRFFAPPDDTFDYSGDNYDFGQGGPWAEHEVGTFFEGHFGILRKGGNKNDVPFPPFLYLDHHVAGPAGGYGLWAGNGTPRLIVGGGFLNWELDDTPEYAGVRVDTDGRGKVLNFSDPESVAGSSALVYRIWGAAMRLDPTTGFPVVSGRSCEILFSDLNWGGEITFIVVPDVANDGTQASWDANMNTRDQVFKISSSYTKAQKRFSLFLQHSDSTNWNQVQWKNFSALAANDLVLYIEDNPADVGNPF